MYLPMCRAFKNRVAVFLAFLFITSFIPLKVTIAESPSYCFKLYDWSDRREIKRIGIRPETRFTLKYIHSVQKSPVYEVYGFDSEGTIYLLETTVESSGYGLPEGETGEDYYFHDGKLTIKSIYKKINQLFIRVSYLNDMMLIVDGQCIHLPQIAPGGHRIEVTIQNASCNK